MLHRIMFFRHFILQRFIDSETTFPKIYVAEIKFSITHNLLYAQTFKDLLVELITT